MIRPRPETEPAVTPETAWERERRTFFQLRPTFLKTHQGQYVAVHDGAVIAGGSDRISVALDAYQRVGYVPLYVGFVREASRRGVRLLSPRLLRSAPRA